MMKVAMCITTSPEVPRAFSTNGGTYGMAIKDVVIKLSPKEVLRLTRILLDEDREEALLFLKENLKLQLDNQTRNH